jgi:hypothetical protein
MVPMLIHIVCTIPRFLPSARKVHPLSKPTMRLNPLLTHKVEENFAFDASALNNPFIFYMHVLESLQFSNDPEIPPHGSNLRAL